MFKGGSWKKVLKPEVKREVVNWWCDQLGQNIERGCKLIELNRSTYYYVKQAEPEENRILRKRLRDLAYERPRYGHPRLYALIRREGWQVNHKRTERLYNEENLNIKRTKKKKRASMVRVEPDPAKAMNEIWAMDFVHDKLWHGKKFRMLTVIDVFTKECLAIKVDTSINGEGVVKVLNRLIEYHGKPKVIRTDNGSEFTSLILDGWMYQNKIDQDFISPGKPTENCYIESFNGKLRDECLNAHYFNSVNEARELIEMWREDYNQVRPHQSLGMKTPAEFKQELLTKTSSVISNHTSICV